MPDPKPDSNYVKPLYEGMAFLLVLLGLGGFCLLASLAFQNVWTVL